MLNILRQLLCKSLHLENQYLRITTQDMVSSFVEYQEFLDEHVNHHRKLLIDHSRRLWILEEKKARFGEDAPAWLILEIEDTTIILRDLRNQMEQLTARLTDADRYGKLTHKDRI